MFSEELKTQQLPETIPNKEGDLTQLSVENNAKVILSKRHGSAGGSPVNQTTTEVHVIQATDRLDLNNLPKNLINIVAKKRPTPLNIGQQNPQLDPKRKVLYRNFHEINCNIYLVELSRNKQKVFILLFPNFEQTDNFLFEILPQKLACKMMRDCNN